MTTLVRWPGVNDGVRPGLIQRAADASDLDAGALLLILTAKKIRLAIVPRLIAHSRFKPSRRVTGGRDIARLEPVGALSGAVGQIATVLVPSLCDLRGDFAPAQAEGQPQRQRD